MKLRLYILTLLACGMAIVLLCHFGCIWLFGEFFISEPNMLVLSLETAGMLVILTFSLYCLREQLHTVPESQEIASSLSQNGFDHRKRTKHS